MVRLAVFNAATREAAQLAGKYLAQAVENASRYYSGKVLRAGEMDLALGRTEVGGDPLMLLKLGLLPGQEFGSDEGMLSDEALLSLAMGQHPITGEQLVEAQPRSGQPRRIWQDFTYSLPKSWSLEYWSATPERRAVMMAEFRATMREVPKMLQEQLRLGRARADKNGIQGPPVKASLVVAYDFHQTSRPVQGLPAAHLHCHMRIFNIALDAEGQWISSDLDALYKNVALVNGLIDADIRKRSSRIGLATETMSKGRWNSFELTKARGFEELMRAHSSRTEVIEAAVAAEENRLGRTLTQAEKTQISRSTREDKARQNISPRQLETRMQEMFAAAGWKSHERSLDLAADLSGARRQLKEWLVAEKMPVWAFTAEGVAAHESTFSRLDMLQAMVARVQERNLNLGYADIAMALESVLKDKRLMVLGDDVFTTVEQYEIEHKVMRLHKELVTQPGLRLTQRDIQSGVSVVRQRVATRRMAELESKILTGADATELADLTAGKSRWSLSEEQLGAVAHLGTDTRFAAIQGHAGAGKTTMLAVFIEGLRAAGYSPIGLSLGAQAASVLGAETGLGQHEVFNIRDFLTRVEHGIIKPSPKDVLVIDEAGVLAFRDALELLGLRSQIAGYRVIGDDEQNLPVGAGSVMRAWLEHAPFYAMTENRRQRQGQERHAVSLIRAGKATEALGIYDSLGQLFCPATLEDGISLTAQRWAEDAVAGIDPRESYMITDLRSARDRLNQAARHTLKDLGLLDAVAIVDGEGREFVEGERIRFAKQYRYEVPALDKNGELVTHRNGAQRIKRVKVPKQLRGTIVRIEDGWITVATDATKDIPSRQCTLRESELHHLDYGYCLTNFSSQGGSMDRIRTLLVKSRLMGRQAANVSFTRDRDCLEVIAPLSAVKAESKEQAIANWGALLSRDRRKTSTLDWNPEYQSERGPRGVGASHLGVGARGRAQEAYAEEHAMERWGLTRKSELMQKRETEASPRKEVLVAAGLRRFSSHRQGADYRAELERSLPAVQVAEDEIGV
jgi:conjugative relaxase-like TrwC/TraI family protein